MRRAPLALAAAWLLAGCQVEHRSDAFACSSNADCANGRICGDQGFCVASGDGGLDGGALDGAAGDANNSDCPEACDACEGALCIIDCSGEGDCDRPIRCETDRPCEIRCLGDRSCSGAIECSSPAGCAVTCEGDESCSGPVSCSGGPCAITCSGVAACAGGVVCDEACACETECSGAQACDAAPVCPGSRPNACRTAGGDCTSARQGCDGCAPGSRGSPRPGRDTLPLP